MISNRTGINIKKESVYHTLQWNTQYLIFWAAIFFYFPQVLAGLWWLLTFNTKVCLSVRKGVLTVHEPILSVWRLSSALSLHKYVVIKVKIISINIPMQIYGNIESKLCHFILCTNVHAQKRYTSNKIIFYLVGLEKHTRWQKIIYLIQYPY